MSPVYSSIVYGKALLIFALSIILVILVLNTHENHVLQFIFSDQFFLSDSSSWSSPPPDPPLPTSDKYTLTTNGDVVGSKVSADDKESMLRYSSTDVDQQRAQHQHPIQRIDNDGEEEELEAEEEEKEVEDEDGHISNPISTSRHSPRESNHSLNEDPFHLIDFTVGGCNIWQGKWVPYHANPPYDNFTCNLIHEHQDCLSNGRPDHGFLHWMWKPHDCELPSFDARNFLKLVKGKSMAFAGDSIARNHFQSLLCLLGQVENPEYIHIDDKYLMMRYYFRSYNFTLMVIWAPYLVKSTEDEITGTHGVSLINLHLDVVDEKLAPNIFNHDYLVLSCGHWFYKPSLYLQDNKIIGGHYLQGTNLTNVPLLGIFFGLRTALRTIFDFLASSDYRGLVLFRTFTPSHFENGKWNDGGTCTKTKPYRRKTIEGMNADVYHIQLEEFAKTLHMENENGVIHSRFKIVDTIHASILRPDGHPGPYRHMNASPHDRPQDCLHWCLPGPIDTWNAMLLKMLSTY